MNEGIVIVNGQRAGCYDVENNGETVSHEGSHLEAVAFARGFSAGIFAETGVIVSVEDHSTSEVQS